MNRLTPMLLAAAGCALPAAAATDEPVLRATGRDLVVNGTAEVPALLFSSHHGPEATPKLVADWGLEGVRNILRAPKGVSASGAPFVLDCLFDRYQPALLLSDPRWEEHLRELARAMGDSARGRPGGSCAVEFWNEPYLNWAAKPGVNFDGLFYDAAGAAPGAPVRPARGGDPVPGLVWDAPRAVAYAEDPRKPDYVATRFMPPGVRAGEDFLWRGKTLHTAERWWARDTRQPSWWAGPVCRDYYLAMAVPFAKALKESAPDLPLVAGWGFHLFEGDWKAWEVVHRPTLDALHPWIDGYDEHHYATDPRRVAMSYEVGWAYMLGTWGRRIGFWNTEAGGVQDPERPDSMHPLPGDGGARGRAAESRGALCYFLRDVLTMAAAVPDKAKMRCAHEPHSTPGVPAGFRLLKPLRGHLSEVVAEGETPPGVLAVAARAGDRLTVVCFNGGRAPAVQRIAVDAPRGARLVSLSRGTVADPAGTGDFAVAWSAPAPLADAARWEGEVSLPPGLAETLVFALEGEAAPAVLRRTQYAGRDLFRRVAPGAPATFRVELPDDALEGATGAAVRWVFSRGNVPATASCNGVPATPAAAPAPFFEARVPLSALHAGENEIVVEAFGAAEVGTATLVVERETP